MRSKYSCLRTTIKITNIKVSDIVWEIESDALVKTLISHGGLCKKELLDWQL